MGWNLVLAGIVWLAAAQQGTAFADAPSPAPTPQPSPAVRRSIAEQISRHVAEVLKAHEAPCARADRLGLPCFPVVTEIEGPRYSVRDALRGYRPGGGPAPGTPTNAEVRKHLSGRPSSTPATLVSLDPGCTLKSLKRLFSGNPNTFYLYRLTDSQGERPLLTDRKITPPARPELQYEFLGTFSGECDAVAAWRKTLRNPRSPAEEDSEGTADGDSTPARQP